MTVVSLSGGHVHDQRQPQSDVIQTLEDALERARGGECVGVFIAEFWYDSMASYSYAGHVTGYALLGAIEEGKTVMREAVRDCNP